MEVDSNKIERKSYLVEIDLIDKGIRESIPQRSITQIEIENNYEINFFPIIKLELTISKYLYLLIKEYRDTIKFRVTLESFLNNEGILAKSFDKDTEKSLIFKSVFQPILPQLIIEDNKSEIDTVTDEENDLNYNLTVYLFELTALNNNKNIINFLAKDCKIKDAVGYILQKCGIKELLMSKPSNNEKIESLIVPPMNFKSSLEFLSDTYGIYKTGLRCFYDFKYMYILDNDLQDVPTINSEFPNVYIFVSALIDNDDPTNIGSYKDDDNKCYIVKTMNNAKISNNDIVNKETISNRIRVYDRTLVENSAKYDKGSKKFTFNKGYEETKINNKDYLSDDRIEYAMNYTENSTNSEKLVKNSNYASTEIVMPILTIDLDIFKINRRYIFRFEDNRLAKINNGEYILAYMATVIDVSKGNSEAVCRFVKVK